MRPSHLFGTLEAPGQKAYPSKDIDYWKLNPKQPVQIETMKIQKKLSNGLVWNHAGEMPLPRFDVFPKLNPEKTWRHLSQGTGSFGAEFKASNPETITSFGILPRYPEEEAMRAMLDSRPKAMAEKVEAREEFPKAEKPEISLPKITSKFTPEKLERLAQMGIPEELIGKAIEEELKKDMMAFLNNPALLAEVQTTEAIQQIYEKYVTKQRSIKTGENAPGDAPGAGSQNVGVRAYSAPAMISMLSPKQQRLAELRVSELGNISKSVMAEMSPALSSPQALLNAMYPRAGAEIEPVRHNLRRSQAYLDIGAGAGGSGLSVSPFGMLAGTRVASQYKAEAQEADEEEEYKRDHSEMENAEGAVLGASLLGGGGFQDRAMEAVGGKKKGKGGRPMKPVESLLETLEGMYAKGAKASSINEQKAKIRLRAGQGADTIALIAEAEARGKAMAGAMKGKTSANLQDVD